jgi:hypothetical protein
MTDHTQECTDYREAFHKITGRDTDCICGGDAIPGDAENDAIEAVAAEIQSAEDAGHLYDPSAAPPGMVTLYCELGKHEWQRAAKRGRKPTNCPDHQPEPAHAITARLADPPQLWCALGQHHWTRELTRGRAPANCPEHRPVAAKVSSEDGRSSARIAGIQAMIDARPPDCTCRIEAMMSDDELQKVESCKLGYVCSTLDKVRRHYVNYGRHTGESTKELEVIEA